MSVIESLKKFNELVTSHQPLEIEFRLSTKNKSEFEHIYNELLHYGFERSAEKHLLKASFNKTNDMLDKVRCEVEGLSNIKALCETNVLPENTQHIKKENLYRKKNDYNMNLNISKEVPMNKTVIDEIYSKWKNTKKTFRLMTRLTLQHPNMPGFIIDMSIVKMRHNALHFKDSGVFEEQELYEIELELNDHYKPIQDVSKMSEHIKKTIKYILSGKDDTSFPISEKIKNDVLNEYKSLFTQSKYIPFIGPSSYTLQRQNLNEDFYPCVKKEFCITDKADGLRKLLYISKEGKLYFITNTNPINVQYTGRELTQDSLKETLIDGEYIRYDKKHERVDLFAGFDIYFYKNGDKVSDVRKQGFQDTRYPLLKKIIQQINQESPNDRFYNSISFIHKEFYFVDEKNDLSLQCGLLLDTIESESYKYNTDGIIFSSSVLGVGMETPQDNVKNKKYVWKHSFKWKPPEFNTIDFLVRFPTNEKGELLSEMIYHEKKTYKYQIIYLYVGNYGTDEIINPQEALLNGVKQSKTPTSDTTLFIPNNPYDKDAYKSYILLEENGNIYTEEGTEKNTRDIIYNNNVVEFKYVMNDDKRLCWVPLRIRFDKEKGNNIHTANSNWNSIHNPVTREMLIDPNAKVEYNNVDEDVYYNKEGLNRNKTKNMRSFHNKHVKTQLYKNYCNEGCTIIDYAVGKAGDLYKWAELKSPFVLGIDISKDNIHNSKDGACIRYLQFNKMSKIKQNYVFIEGNTSKRLLNNEFAENNKVSSEVMDHVLGIKRSSFSNLPKFGISTKGFQLGSIQFALHYMFENELTINSFIYNCCKTIQLNGHLIGTCYDGQLVYEKLKDKKDNEIVELYVDTTKIWHIRKKYDDNINLQQNHLAIKSAYFKILSIQKKMNI
ncbi:putative mRNA capping enzyme [Organic Lake phycodnavirus 1]|nr:putative mRNA capping enzyme [Organic Lake phycodnavirus 1]